MLTRAQNIIEKVGLSYQTASQYKCISKRLTSLDTPYNSVYNKCSISGSLELPL